MIIYFFQQAEIKSEMQAFIKKNPKEHCTEFTFQLTESKIADKDFTWEDEGKEFDYRGKMYDVVNFQQTGNRLIIHAINDSQEEKLMADFTQHHKQTENLSLNKLISLVFIKTEYRPIDIVQNILVHTEKNKVTNLQLIPLPIQSPPPDFV